MKHLQTFALWAVMLALEFALILAIVVGVNALNPGLAQSLATLAKGSAPFLATVVLGTIGLRAVLTAARDRIGLRNAGDRAALQAWVRSRKP